jgi:SPOR domain
MAYALGPMGPDERHERIFVRRRSRRVFVIMLALVAMLGSSGAFYAIYRVMTRPAAPATVPLIHADSSPVEHRPANPGGMQAPGQGTMVLDNGHGEPKVEQLLPPPEAPLPRPTPAESAAEPSAAAPAPVAAVPATPAAPATATPPVAPPAPSPAAAEAQATAKPAPVAAKPREKPVAALEKPTPARVVAGHGYRLQVGAVRSPEAAKQEWDRLKRLHADLLGDLGVSTERVDLGQRGIFYRIQAGPIADAAKAERDCNELRQHGVGCILVKP